MDQDKRKQLRKSTSVTTHVTYYSSRTGEVETTIGETQNLSRGGVQLKLYRLSEIEEIRELMLKLPGHDEPIKTAGELRWKSEQEDFGLAGIRFTSLSSDQQKVIKNYLDIGKDESNEIIEKATLLRFQEIKSHIKQILDLSESEQQRLNSISPLDIYSCADVFEIRLEEVAELIAEHLEVEYKSELPSEKVKADRLPPQFCQNYSTVPFKTGLETRHLVVSNPFQHLFYSAFHDYHGGAFEHFSIACPKTITDTLRKKYNTDPSVSQSTTTSSGPYALHVGNEGNQSGIPFSLYADSYEFKNLNDKAAEDQSIAVDQLLKQFLRSMLEEGIDEIYLDFDGNHLYIRLDMEVEPETHLDLSIDLIRAFIIRVKILAGLDITDRWSSREGEFPIIHYSNRDIVRASVNGTPGQWQVSLRILDE